MEDIVDLTDSQLGALVDTLGAKLLAGSDRFEHKRQAEQLQHANNAEVLRLWHIIEELEVELAETRRSAAAQLAEHEAAAAEQSAEWREHVERALSMHQRAQSTLQSTQAKLLRTERELHKFRAKTGARPVAELVTLLRQEVTTLKAREAVRAAANQPWTRARLEALQQRQDPPVELQPPPPWMAAAAAAVGAAPARSGEEPPPPLPSDDDVEAEAARLNPP